MKKLLAIVLALIMVIAFAVPALAGTGTRIGLKGSGSSFDGTWKNVFVWDADAGAFTNESSVGFGFDGEGENIGTYPDRDAYHIVFTDKGNIGEVNEVVIDFGSVVFEGTGSNVSVNNGGNNPGWVIVVPKGWAINLSQSWLFTTGGGNPQFNISGFNAGNDDDDGGLVENCELVPSYSFDFALHLDAAIGGSTTLTAQGNGGTFGNAWFTWIRVNDLYEGQTVTFDLVQGKKLKKVGTAEFAIIDDNLVITLDLPGGLKDVHANIGIPAQNAPGQMNLNKLLTVDGKTITIPLQTLISVGKGAVAVDSTCVIHGPGYRTNPECDFYVG